MNCFVFGEGKTELYVMEYLLKYVLGYKFAKMHRGKGKDRQLSIFLPDLDTSPYVMIKETGGKQTDDQIRIIGNTLEPELSLGVQCLALADCDEHDTMQSLQTKYEHIFLEVVKKRFHPLDVSLQVVEGWQNILLYQTPSELPTIRFVLHIAQAPTIPTLEQYSFHNATTDNYLLAIALTDGVLDSFANDASEGQPDHPIGAKTLQSKVVQEIPELLIKNGFKNLDAKDFNAIYMTVARFLKNTVDEPQVSFVKALMGCAIKEAQAEFEQVFASHIAAIKLLTQEE
jgi:hypothetical protein